MNSRRATPSHHVWSPLPSRWLNKWFAPAENSCGNSRFGTYSGFGKLLNPGIHLLARRVSLGTLPIEFCDDFRFDWRMLLFKIFEEFADFVFIEFRVIRSISFTFESLLSLNWPISQRFGKWLFSQGSGEAETIDLIAGTAGSQFPRQEILPLNLGDSWIYFSLAAPDI
jgi:hypothetical protein